VVLLRTARKQPHLCLFGLLLLVSAGCATGVGDPCQPEQIPEGGFAETEAYIETSSVQCETRVCGVFKFVGDPRTADRRVVEDKIYCTCRCKAPDPDFAVCDCPDDFECQEVLDLGGPGVRGSYCVRRGQW
jgi:hypothetical protein